jgi:hypothetical protein
METKMRSSLPLALAAILACGLALAAGTAQAQTTSKPKKTSLAECATMLDPFHNKKSDVVKDETIAEYVPLIKNYWKKHCPADFYARQVADADLRKRIDAAVPPPKTNAKKPG